MADPLVIIRAALVADANVTAIVPAVRITPLVKPQASSEPSITLTLVDNEPENHLQGYANLDHARVAVEYWATDYDVAKDLADKGRTAVSAADRLLVFEVRDYDFELKLYRIQQDFSLSV